ncbi:HpcH/HpaI aldolase family protein [Rathayibacter soli]|uniref:HpcH/HpaI aldolase family protein n=1 Tax=Rathayibacter soli TaxID=3144168 RepID=UPI0027E447EE|nr:HpcH/HpaI aldolase/citrate lyase family protein [Glaciibacter superstes]
MSFRVELPPTFADRLAASTRPQIGIWVCSTSPLVAEICAGSGLDALLIDGEHGPNTLESVLAQLQAVAAYPITPLVRLPSADTVLVKQLLDAGAQNLLAPMVNSADEARAMVRAMRYPPLGVRGVGSALARSSRWSRVDDYLARAHELVSLFVQIETAEAVSNAEEIAALEGIDGIFLGPADLAASMGHLGQQDHPNVVSSVEHTITVAKRLGTHVGVNAFAPAMANHYLAAGADFVFVGSDVTLLARGAEALAAAYLPADSEPDAASGPTADE